MEAAAGPSIPKTAPAESPIASLLDYGERAVLVMLYLLLAQQLLPSLGREPNNTLLLISESVVVGFVVLRRRTANVTKIPLDWLLALAGAVLPLFLRPGGRELGPSALGGALMLAGLLTHVGAKFSLRRSFGMAAANRGVKVGGIYRLVRHPMYLGYAIVWAGFLLLNPLPANLALVTCAALVQALRVLAEERLLAGDPIYRDYMARVRFRVIPGLF